MEVENRDLRPDQKVTVKAIDIMLRIFVLSVISVVLVPVYWLTAQFVTPGVVIANRIVASQPERG